MLNKDNKTSVKVYENENCMTHSGLLVMEFEYCDDLGHTIAVDTYGALFTPELLEDNVDYGFFIDLFLEPSVYNPL